MKRIISVSRRTDIPAFYGDWFMRRLDEGFAGVVNPFGGLKYLISLKPEDVVCFVFWSKNFAPFVENLRIIESLGYRFYFNYTVTSLPGVFENDVDKPAAIEALKELSRTYSSRHLNWRFDPIIISSICDREFYVRTFVELASEFEEYVERCYISFVTNYSKVRCNFEELERTAGVEIVDCSEDFKIDLANELAATAGRHGIRMYSCCGDYLTWRGGIEKAHCIDGGIIENLFYPEGLNYIVKPTREECGCTESSDIGAYDTCPHGCVYCYANVHKHRAWKAFANHEKDSAFLGYSKSKSDAWLDEIRDDISEKGAGAPTVF
ncbi:MAG: DUF1848 domain-containing protein [Phycisphaerales bacterium]|nr:MAG: DUF1848 domain-containing protein [Phycisphaerales bacterium]